jgi:nitroreductase
MKLNLSVDEVLTTTRSVRLRLDYDRAVDRSIVEECINLARFAPSGGNSQAWHFIIIEDDAKKKFIADKYLTNFAKYTDKISVFDEESPDAVQRMDRNKASAWHLAENMHRIPIMVLGCIEGRLDKLPSAAQAGMWGSIVPTLWSFNLALRERALGTCWTTIHLMSRGEKMVADLLDIPYDDVTQVALFPIAYTKGTDFQPAERKPITDFTHYDRW